ncbi:hypothetical protein KFK09_022189 [Dendrobium nobile]|uniref:Uncharacterized protein n=1 Tax=Dendrobium nobile TaxID=94219 RepID=A0A8T3AJA9_DENNO|nr:hypothetical protein KFK09_022189 [Dendrobium nobile]
MLFGFWFFLCVFFCQFLQESGTEMLKDFMAYPFLGAVAAQPEVSFKLFL